MYFASRLQAGRLLAGRIAENYHNQKCAVVALDDGGVMVGAQIANQLHCVLNLLLTAEITLPREPQAIAGITSGGTLAYNHDYSEGELSEMVGEYYNTIEQEKLTRMHDLNRLLGEGGVIDRKLLAGHTIILVSEGLKTGFPLDLAVEFLKPIATTRLVVAVPLASVQAVDRMHILADEIYCLSVVADYMETSHYYDKQDVPDHQTILSTLEEVVRKWREPAAT